MAQAKQSEKDKPSSYKALILAVSAIVVVIVLIIAFGKISPEEPETIDELHEENLGGKETEENFVYNGYSFVWANGLWYTQISDASGGTVYDVPLHYSPRDVEDVEIEGNPDAWMAYTLSGVNSSAAGDFRSMTYVTFDPEDNLGYVALANGELSVNVVKTLSLGVVAACTKNVTEACAQIPLKTCENTDAPVIYLKASGEAKVIQDENCLILQGETTGIVKAVDRFLYHMYGVMDR